MSSDEDKPLSNLPCVTQNDANSLKLKISLAGMRITDSTRVEVTSRNLFEVLTEIHNLLVRRDQRGIFAHPVTDDIAIGYSQTISHPMDLSTIHGRLKSRAHYTSATDYLADVTLMCDNAMVYNPPDTIYHQRARKLLIFSRKQLLAPSLRKLCNQLGIHGGLTEAEMGEFSATGELPQHHVHQMTSQCSRRLSGGVGGGGQESVSNLRSSTRLTSSFGSPLRDWSFLSSEGNTSSPSSQSTEPPRRDTKGKRGSPSESVDKGQAKQTVLDDQTTMIQIPKPETPTPDITKETVDPSQSSFPPTKAPRGRGRPRKKPRLVPPPVLFIEQPIEPAAVIAVSSAVAISYSTSASSITSSTCTTSSSPMTSWSVQRQQLIPTTPEACTDQVMLKEDDNDMVDEVAAQPPDLNQTASSPLNLQPLTPLPNIIDVVPPNLESELTPSICSDSYIDPNPTTTPPEVINLPEMVLELERIQSPSPIPIPMEVKAEEASLVSKVVVEQQKQRQIGESTPTLKRQLERELDPTMQPTRAKIQSRRQSRHRVDSVVARKPRVHKHSPRRARTHRPKRSSSPPSVCFIKPSPDVRATVAEEEEEELVHFVESETDQSIESSSFEETRSAVPPPPPKTPEPEEVIQARQMAAKAAERLRAKYAGRCDTLNTAASGLRIVYLDSDTSGQVTAVACPNAVAHTTPVDVAHDSAAAADSTTNDALAKTPNLRVNYPPVLVHCLTGARPPTEESDENTGPSIEETPPRTKTTTMNKLPFVDPFTASDLEVLRKLDRLKYNSEEPITAAIHGPLSIFSTPQMIRFSDVYGCDLSTIEYAHSLLKFVQPMGKWARQWAAKRLDQATDGMHSKLANFFDAKTATDGVGAAGADDADSQQTEDNNKTASAGKLEVAGSKSSNGVKEACRPPKVSWLTSLDLTLDPPSPEPSITIDEDSDTASPIEFKSFLSSLTESEKQTEQTPSTPLTTQLPRSSIPMRPSPLMGTSVEQKATNSNQRPLACKAIPPQHSAPILINVSVSSQPHSSTPTITNSTSESKTQQPLGTIEELLNAPSGVPVTSVLKTVLKSVTPTIAGPTLTTVNATTTTNTRLGPLSTVIPTDSSPVAKPIHRSESLLQHSPQLTPPTSIARQQPTVDQKEVKLLPEIPTKLLTEVSAGIDVDSTSAIIRNLPNDAIEMRCPVVSGATSLKAPLPSSPDAVSLSTVAVPDASVENSSSPVVKTPLSSFPVAPSSLNLNVDQPPSSSASAIQFPNSLLLKAQVSSASSPIPGPEIPSTSATTLQSSANSASTVVCADTLIESTSSNASSSLKKQLASSAPLVSSSSSKLCPKPSLTSDLHPSTNVCFNELETSSLPSNTADKKQSRLDDGFDVCNPSVDTIVTPSWPSVESVKRETPLPSCEISSSSLLKVALDRTEPTDLTAEEQRKVSISSQNVYSSPMDVVDQNEVSDSTVGLVQPAASIFGPEMYAPQLNGSNRVGTKDSLCEVTADLVQTSASPPSREASPLPSDHGDRAVTTDSLNEATADLVQASASPPSQEASPLLSDHGDRAVTTDSLNEATADLVQTSASPPSQEASPLPSDHGDRAVTTDSLNEATADLAQTSASPPSQEASPLPSDHNDRAETTDSLYEATVKEPTAELEQTSAFLPSQEASPVQSDHGDRVETSDSLYEATVKEQTSAFLPSQEASPMPSDHGDRVETTDSSYEASLKEPTAELEQTSAFLPSQEASPVQSDHSDLVETINEPTAEPVQMIASLPDEKPYSLEHQDRFETTVDEQTVESVQTLPPPDEKMASSSLVHEDRAETTAFLPNEEAPSLPSEHEDPVETIDFLLETTINKPTAEPVQTIASLPDEKPFLLEHQDRFETTVESVQTTSSLLDEDTSSSPLEHEDRVEATAESVKTTVSLPRQEASSSPAEYQDRFETTVDEQTVESIQSVPLPPDEKTSSSPLEPEAQVGTTASLSNQEAPSLPSEHENLSETMVNEQTSELVQTTASLPSQETSLLPSDHEYPVETTINEPTVEPVQTIASLPDEKSYLLEHQYQFETTVAHPSVEEPTAESVQTLLDEKTSPSPLEHEDRVEATAPNQEASSLPSEHEDRVETIVHEPTVESVQTTSFLPTQEASSLPSEHENRFEITVNESTSESVKVTSSLSSQKASSLSSEHEDRVKITDSLFDTTAEPHLSESTSDAVGSKLPSRRKESLLFGYSYSDSSQDSSPNLSLNDESPSTLGDSSQMK